MRGGVTGFARPGVSCRATWIALVRHALLLALDRHVCRQDRELPPEWFKHPPI